MGNLIVKIAPDGSAVFSLYDDKSPLIGLGKLEVVRASNVVWDGEKQTWRIEIIRANGVKAAVPIDFKNRSDAIKFEQELLPEIILAKTQEVENLFATE